MTALNFTDKEPALARGHSADADLSASNAAFYSRLQGKTKKTGIERFGWVALPLGAVAILGVVALTSTPHETKNDVVGGPAQTAALSKPAPAMTPKPEALASNSDVISSSKALPADQVKASIEGSKAPQAQASQSVKAAPAPAPVKTARAAPAKSSPSDADVAPAAAAPAQRTPMPSADTAPAPVVSVPAPAATATPTAPAALAPAEATPAPATTDSASPSIQAPAPTPAPSAAPSTDQPAAAAPAQ